MSRDGGVPVLVDIQATQSLDYRDRGVARYVRELALALCDLAPERVGGLLLNPDLGLPAGLEQLLATGKLRLWDEVELTAGTVLHLTSPYELAVPLHRLVPPALLPLVATVYDVVPEVYPDPYLADPGLRQRYRARHHLVRQAAAVLTLSEATRRDAVDRLELRPDRVTVVGAGVSPVFVPPGCRREAAEKAARLVAGLRPPFVLYTGATDFRKNVEGLMRGWAALPAELLGRYQLVIACGLKPLERNHYEVEARRLGFGDGLLLPGFVSDAALLALYQGTDLFVFPSRYEGYGLPVAEALACGAPVVAADTSALTELVAAPALFDPEDPADLAAVVSRALVDDDTRSELLRRAGRAPQTWEDVARRTLAAYDRVAADPSRPPPRHAPRRPRLAVATPLPPDPSPAARSGYALLDELRRSADVSAFVDRPPGTPPGRDGTSPAGVDVHPVAALGRVEAIDGPFDAVVYTLGDSPVHAGALAALRRRPGLVVAHDARLTRLYQATPDGFAAAVGRMYAGRVPPDVAPDDADHWGLVMAREVLRLCAGYLATTPAVAAVARLDAHPADRAKVTVTTDDPAGLAAAILGKAGSA